MKELAISSSSDLGQFLTWYCQNRNYTSPRPQRLAPSQPWLPCNNGASRFIWLFRFYLGMYFPDPVSEKKVVKESSAASSYRNESSRSTSGFFGTWYSAGIDPSGWIPCSRQYSSLVRGNKITKKTATGWHILQQGGTPTSRRCPSGRLPGRCGWRSPLSWWLPLSFTF